MALTTCPDCKNEISNAADKCIHCGRPMRLSREAILVEIQNSNLEMEKMWEVINYINQLRPLQS
jgi:predicted amidophosphoribosyltransferase